ncbi:MAG: bifunctional DNA primase/polymerase, partial [Planctomycetaceae bacterium]
MRGLLMTPERLNPHQVDSLCDFIGRGIRAGLALHPIAPDGSKAAIGKWGRISRGEQPPQSTEDLVMLVRSGACDGVAVLAGRASGNIEMLEVEGRCVERLDELARIAEDTGIRDLFQCMTNGWSELTPSAGVHFYYRVSDGPVAGNTVLAQRPKTDGTPEVLAETRGQGGYSICAPSGGRTHETGFSYEFLNGGPENVPTFTAAEGEELHRLFRL